ncbi:unnamed protein product [Notodromas monacha]|uniref:Cyclase n=1 Tax=Notodromas monacha TaxID=399045 RepID=A0A7R9G9F8_9CRUS|nr:unnamed protein product [Notodromas monacha]CAG0913162.1 unnamed protein product [Notodromas monacha]
MPSWLVLALALVLDAVLVLAHHAPHPLAALGNWVDLTYDFGADSVHWPDADFQDFRLVSEIKDFLSVGDDQFWTESNTVCSPEHLGTHVDAPSHFAKDRWTAGNIPLSHLVAPGVKLDFSVEANADNNYAVSKERIIEWEKVHGRIPLNAVVLLYFDWERRWPSVVDMFNTPNPADNTTFKFPGLDPDAATWLVSDRSIVAVGTDTPSIDRGQETQYRSHIILYDKNVYGLEMVANLSRLPATQFDVFIAPLKLAEGSGGPVRIAAFVLKEDGADLGYTPQHGATENIVVSYASRNVANWIDLSHPLSPTIPHWPTSKPLNYTLTRVLNSPYIEYRSFCMGEHLGTHLDAARHFSKNGQSINEIPLDHLLGVPGVKFSIKDKAAEDVNSVLTVADVEEWEKRHGQVPQGAVVLLEFGWADKWDEGPEVFVGSKVPGDPESFNFPGFDKPVVDWLFRNRDVVGFGTEGLSLDAGSSTHFPAHRAIASAGLFGIENVAHLDEIPPSIVISQQLSRTYARTCLVL